jgi:DNA invertase Pin-like site-specific DNA recombinase
MMCSYLKGIPDFKRQTIQEILELVESAKIDVLLIYELLRIARIF